MTLYERIQDGVAAIIQAYKESKADEQLTFGEVVALVLLFINRMIGLVGQVAGYSPEERKDAILAAVEQFVDLVITPIDLKPVPNWIEPVVDRGVKTVIMEVARGAVDALVSILDRVPDFGPLPGPVEPPHINDGQILALCIMPVCPE